MLHIATYEATVYSDSSLNAPTEKLIQNVRRYLFLHDRDSIVKECSIELQKVFKHARFKAYPRDKTSECLTNLLLSVTD